MSNKDLIKLIGETNGITEVTRSEVEYYLNLINNLPKEEDVTIRNKKYDMESLYGLPRTAATYRAPEATITYDTVVGVYRNILGR
jgi:hypothetical protein